MASHIPEKELKHSFKVNKLARFLYFNWPILSNLITYLLTSGKME